MSWSRSVNKEQQIAQVSDLCRRRLLNYADSFQELARSYDLEFLPSEGVSQDRQTILEEKRLWENRQAISGHLNEVAKIMTETACEALTLTPMEARKRRKLTQALAEEGIYAENPCYFAQGNGKQAIILSMRTARGQKIAAEDAADMISVVLDKRLQLSVSSPYTIESEPRSFILEEESDFLVLTGFSRAVKEDEVVSGDNYAVIEAEKGRMTIMLSDGTGSGEKACRDSERVLDLMEKMLEAGYETGAAVNMVNTALFAVRVLQLPNAVGEDGNHPTLDICEIDLYQGSCQFRKIGGAATFLKRSENGEVEQLALGNLPLGIFPQIDVTPLCRKLEDGDYLIMVSDGVVDAFEKEDYENRISEIIAGIEDSNPGDIAERLLRIALRASGGRVHDDMTIGVIGIWENQQPI